ncbi:putative F-box protein PP2-B12 [Argentina anserina]|uniref:putative F-box protein PP2-B12 n=1 Tax=Argentina anserina TaxID=57926 RepID=UPI0021767854|nr:putative F-box protein PP2-B12 [Potentilla anserina]
MVGLERLSEECIACILSLTSPKDACRSALVSSAFGSAAQSQVVWERFLPSDHRDIISRSVSPVTFTSKMELYFRLCDSPIFLDDGNLSFAIDKLSGKKCFTLGARRVLIAWGDTPAYWEWISVPHSRFAEVAYLRSVCWLEIYGRMEMRSLSPNTAYAGHLVYMFSDEATNYAGTGQNYYETFPVKLSVKFFVTEGTLIEAHDEEDAELLISTRMPAAGASSMDNSFGKRQHFPMERNDGWMEIKIGEFNCGQSDDDCCLVEVGVKEIESGIWKFGLVIHGIEIRPTQPKPN